MNERIDALVKKATIRVNNPILNTDGKIVVDDWQEGISISKFAELIVRECVAICEDTEGEHIADAKWGRRCCALEIREHFGIEE
jgi:hypothetical protein